MKKPLLAAALVLAFACAQLASGAEIKGELGESYSLSQGDSLALEGGSVALVEANPPDEAVVSISSPGQETPVVARLERSKPFNLGFAFSRLDSVESRPGGKVVVVIAVAAREEDLKQVTESPPKPATASDAESQPTATPRERIVSAAPEQSGVAASIAPTQVEAVAQAEEFEEATATPRVRRGRNLVEAAAAYPADEIPLLDGGERNCSGEQFVEAIAVAPAQVVQGSNVSMLIEDGLEQTPVASTFLKVVFPSRRAFAVRVDERGIAQFNAVERGAYKFEARGCYELEPAGVFALHPQLPERLRWLPAALLQPLSDNLDNLFYAAVAALLIGLAWFSYRFIKQRGEDDDGDGGSVWDQFREKVYGRDEGQTAIEYLLLLGGVILIAVIAISIVRTQIAAPVKDSIGGGVSNLTSILGGFNKSG